MKKNSIIIALLIIIIVVIGIFVFTGEKAVAPTTNPITTAPAAAAEHCGLKVTSPLPGSQIAFPLTINAVVDNTNATALGCSWGAFEAVAGPIVLKDANGATLATSSLTTTSNWMTTGPVNYSATISSISNPSYTGAVTLMFTEDNASDNPNPDTLSFSVIK